jgi:hypothetical protein
MAKKWIAISVLLFIVACLLGWWLRVSIRNFNAENDLENIQTSRDRKQKIAQDKPLPQPPPGKRYIPEEFAVIPENNVFSESRSSEEDATENAAQTEAQPLAQKPSLVGINIMDNQKTALLVDPRPSSQGRNRRAEIKRIGDVFQGYTIADIAPDHIVLESGSRKEIVPLHEGSKQTPGGRTPILSTRVVSFGGGSVSGGTPVVSSAGSAGAARAAAAPKSIPAVESQPKAVAVASVTPVTQTREESPAREQPPRQTGAQQQSPAAGSSQPKTRVIRTPFGDVVRAVRE